jgi:hypothetical protein
LFQWLWRDHVRHNAVFGRRDRPKAGCAEEALRYSAIGWHAFRHCAAV